MTAAPDQSPLINEQLSAWLDDELPDGELRLLALRLEDSPEYQARIARYSLIGSTLRGGAAGAKPAGLAALQVSGRVSAALASSGRSSTLPAKGPARRLMPYAVAAGVVLLAVALIPVLRGGPGPVAPASLAMTPVQAPSTVSGRLIERRQASLSPGRLTNYLVYHGEYSGMLSAKLTDSHIVNNRPYAAAQQLPDQIQSR